MEQGDTLYSIAWRYDLPVDVLADINKLNQPYIIKQGQILHLDLNLSLKINPTQQFKNYQGAKQWAEK